MSAPLVSTVIPAYNGERWLAGAIDSALGQTMADVECIVIDDGSTDGTRDILSHYGTAIRVLGQPNLGIARARNVGISAARGRFVAFLDHDDCWRPTKLERQLELFAIKPELGLVYTSFEKIDEEGASLGVAVCAHPDDVLRQILSMLPGAPVGLCQSGVVPTTVLRSLGGFDERLSVRSDADLVCKIFRAYPVARLLEPMACYRLTPSGAHNNLEISEHDAAIMLHTHLCGGDAVKIPGVSPRKSFANLYVGLSVAYADRRQWRSAARRAAMALISHPWQAVVTACKEARAWALLRLGRQRSDPWDVPPSAQ